MIPDLRREFNKHFTTEKYQSFLGDLNAYHPGAIDFRVAETPLFVPREFTRKMIDACEGIVDLLVDPDFRELTQYAIPKKFQVPNESAHPQFIAFDFAVCKNEHGDYEPQLIEMQGFPSLLAFQALIPEVSDRHFPAPKHFTCYFNGFNQQTYLESLRDIIVGDLDPRHVILLEILPHQQKTRIDFYCTEDYLGIKTVCVSELIREGEKIYYKLDGKKTEVKRIYNRVIFDDLEQQSPEMQEKGKIFFEDLDVQWCPHPNWFYRISKYTLPLIHHPYVPETYFLNEVKQAPDDLENFVLKPLFSFAGQGVVIDLSPEDIEKVKDPENWILQRKVQYADAIETPDVPAKAEIRIFYFWKDGEPRPIPANNLARLSKGKMVGVRYNKDKEWVGGSFCWFDI